MKTYEGMYIFPKKLSDEQLDEAIETAGSEIEKLGGQVKNTIRLGRRDFARMINKQKSGHYVVFIFEIDGDQISPLLARYKLSESVMRVQFVRAEENTGSKASEAKAESAE